MISQPPLPVIFPLRIFMSTYSLSTELRVVGASTQLEIVEIGHGRPILFLHPGIGLRGPSHFSKHSAASGA